MITDQCCCSVESLQISGRILFVRAQNHLVKQVETSALLYARWVIIVAAELSLRIMNVFKKEQTIAFSLSCVYFGEKSGFFLVIDSKVNIIAKATNIAKDNYSRETQGLSISLIFRLGRIKAVAPPLVFLLFPENSQQMRAHQQEADGEQRSRLEQEPNRDDILLPLLQGPRDLGS